MIYGEISFKVQIRESKKNKSDIFEFLFTKSISVQTQFKYDILNLREILHPSLSINFYNFPTFNFEKMRIWGVKKRFHFISAKMQNLFQLLVACHTNFTNFKIYHTNSPKKIFQRKIAYQNVCVNSNSAPTPNKYLSKFTILGLIIHTFKSRSKYISTTAGWEFAKLGTAITIV